MRTTLFVLLASCAALLSNASPVPTFLLRDDLPPLQTTFTVRPVAGDTYQPLRRVSPGMYRCSTLIVEGEGDRRIGLYTKEVLLHMGESRKEHRKIGELDLYFAVSISKAGDTASGALTVSRNGKAVLQQISQVDLRQPADGFKPLQ